jgi:NhaP-type Na+/H+ and K+/H+ antiporter
MSDLKPVPCLKLEAWIKAGFSDKEIIEMLLSNRMTHYLGDKDGAAISISNWSILADDILSFINKRADVDRMHKLEQRNAELEKEADFHETNNIHANTRIAELVEALHTIMAQVQYESCECAVMKTITEALAAQKVSA